MATSTELRDKASRLAPSDARSALVLARQVREPWFRAQALAAVARWSDDNKVEALAKESLAAAASCDDDFKRSAVAAWPIRALAERGSLRAARQALAVARGQALACTPMGSRAEALIGILHGGWLLGPGVHRELVEDLAHLQSVSDHWRVSRALVDALGMLSRTEPLVAKEIASRVDDQKCQRRALARIEADDARGPRSYF